MYIASRLSISLFNSVFILSCDGTVAFVFFNILLAEALRGKQGAKHFHGHDHDLLPLFEAWFVVERRGLVEAAVLLRSRFPFQQ